MIDPKTCIAVWHENLPYEKALDLQMRICDLKKHGYEKDVLLLLEHPPTITLGRNAKGNNLLASQTLLKTRGVALWNVDRGGDVTFHGPGQLVGYPILFLRSGERDVHQYMRNLEESLIRLLAGYGIEGARDPSFTGVWTQNGKIAAMGVHISRWITRHGFAINANTDLSYFGLIVPCGIIGKKVTSMQEHLLRSVDLADLAHRYIGEFGFVFNRKMVQMSERQLLEDLQHHSEKIREAAKSKHSGMPVP